MSIFHRHTWHYALGTSKGIMSGRVREICFRRYCPKCHQHQHIDHYNSTSYGIDGDTYLGRPSWINGFTPNEESIL